MLYARDERLRLLYFRAVSREIRDAQWKFYADSFERDGAAPGSPPFAIVFESMAGSAMPSAKWRKRFAEVGTTTRRDVTFVLVTDSPLARAVIKGVNWLRPFEFHYAVVGSFGEAVDFACRQRREPEVREGLAALLGRLELVGAS